MHTSPLQIHYLCHLPFVLTSNLSRGRIFRSREAIKIDTYPAAVRPSVLDAAVVPRVIDARIFTRAGKAGEPATETPQGDAEAGTIGGDGAAVRELVGGVDAERTVGWAGFKAKTAANLGFGGSFTAILLERPNGVSAGFGAFKSCFVFALAFGGLRAWANGSNTFAGHAQGQGRDKEVEELHFDFVWSVCR